jgi:predicted MFS family arabinose efflux permease
MNKNGNEMTKLVAAIITVVGLATVIGAALGWRFPYQRSANRTSIVPASVSTPTPSPTPISRQLATPAPSPSPSSSPTALPTFEEPPADSEPVNGFW